jgi:hypothetical protein
VSRAPGWRVPFAARRGSGVGAAYAGCAVLGSGASFGSPPLRGATAAGTSGTSRPDGDGASPAEGERRVFVLRLPRGMR